ncbi:MAG: hypothetical protein V1685_01885 [Parcubacteria group bacterium]
MCNQTLEAVGCQRRITVFPRKGEPFGVRELIRSGDYFTGKHADTGQTVSLHKNTIARRS